MADEKNKEMIIPVGDTVLCDDCNGDWTARPESGGIVFESKAICPDCTPAWLEDAAAYKEEYAIRERCPEGMSFADFIRAYRGPDAVIRIISGKDIFRG